MRIAHQCSICGKFTKYEDLRGTRDSYLDLPTMYCPSCFEKEEAAEVALAATSSVVRDYLLSKGKLNAT